jgi:hypothetical protein
VRLPKHCNVLEMNIADVSSTAPLALEVDERPLCERLMTPVWQEGFARIFSAKIAVAINSVQTLSMVLQWIAVCCCDSRAHDYVLEGDVSHAAALLAPNSHGVLHEVAVPEQNVLSWVSEVPTSVVHAALNRNGVVAHVNEAILNQHVARAVGVNAVAIRGSVAAGGDVEPADGHAVAAIRVQRPECAVL